MPASVSPVVFFLVLHLFAVDTNPSPLSYEIDGYIKVYKNGTVQRLTGTETVPPSFDPNTSVLSKDITISPNRNITARLFLPLANVTGKNSTNKKLPLLVYFHGGAFFTNSAFSPTYHDYMNSLAAKAQVIAASVNYRLAPEQYLPVGYQDSWLALQWVFSHTPKGRSNSSESWLKMYVDFEHVYIGGDSAGGNIAHNMAIRAGLDETAGVLLDGLFLNCPHFWGKKLIGNEPNYPMAQIAWAESIWEHAYPNSTGGLDDPMVNPGKDHNLSMLGCRRVLVYVAEKDILKDRGLYYGEVLKESGWKGDVKVVEVKGEDHVFNLNFPDTEKSKAMLDDVGLFLNHGLNATWPKPALRPRDDYQQWDGASMGITLPARLLLLFVVFVLL